jgi:hypothetical protein
MQPLYVSFYTPGYAGEAAGLIASLDAFGLEHQVLALPSTGAWVRNCSLKARYISGRAEAHPGRPLVWIDADARVVAKPALLADLDCDFAAHWLYDAELLSGTLYFGPTLAAQKLIALWEFGCEAEPDEWDQRILQRCVERASGLRVSRLPPEYTWIQGEREKDIGETAYGKREPVIVHRQASRLHRHDRT